MSFLRFVETFSCFACFIVSCLIVFTRSSYSRNSACFSLNIVAIFLALSCWSASSLIFSVSKAASSFSLCSLSFSAALSLSKIEAFSDCSSPPLVVNLKLLRRVEALVGRLNAQRRTWLMLRNGVRRPKTILFANYKEPLK